MLLLAHETNVKVYTLMILMQIIIYLLCPKAAHDTYKDKQLKTAKLQKNEIYAHKLVL